MNVVRNSTSSFDPDKLIGTASRVSLAGSLRPHVQITDGMHVNEIRFNFLGVNAFYRKTPQGEMSMARMDHLARLRLGCMCSCSNF